MSDETMMTGALRRIEDVVTRILDRVDDVSTRLTRVEVVVESHVDERQRQDERIRHLENQVNTWVSRAHGAAWVLGLAGGGGLLLTVTSLIAALLAVWRAFA